MPSHFLMKNQSGNAAFEKLDAPEFAAADYDGWESLAVEASGIFFFMFKIDADAVDYPLHASPDAWLGYVVEGAGYLTAGNQDGSQELDRATYQAGDFITFEPNTQHGWSNGNTPAKILFVKTA